MNTHNSFKGRNLCIFSTFKGIFASFYTIVINIEPESCKFLSNPPSVKCWSVRYYFNYKASRERSFTGPAFFKKLNEIY